MYNEKVVNFLEPKKMMLLGLGFWFMLFLISPFTPREKFSYDSYIFIFLNIICFQIGSLLVVRKKMKFHNTRKVIIKYFSVFFYLALLGVSLKIYDSFFIRDISFSSTSFENRESSIIGAGNVIGILGSLLSPISYYVLFLMLRYEIKFSKMRKYIIILLPFVQVLDSFAMGSRSSLFVVFLFFAIILILLNKIKFSFFKTILYSSIVFFVFLLMQYIFIQRTKEFSSDRK